mmetsp:Transcript_82929/g.257912  ORF Transcript_82929/g.257912 Transcript_82929/m.257912 type:complete len:349 (+) Transcript_82929:123-1169(+)
MSRKGHGARALAAARVRVCVLSKGTWEKRGGGCGTRPKGRGRSVGLETQLALALGAEGRPLNGHVDVHGAAGLDLVCPQLQQGLRGSRVFEAHEGDELAPRGDVDIVELAELLEVGPEVLLRDVRGHPCDEEPAGQHPGRGGQGRGERLCCGSQGQGALAGLGLAPGHRDVHDDGLAAEQVRAAVLQQLRHRGRLSVGDEADAFMARGEGAPGHEEIGPGAPLRKVGLDLLRRHLRPDVRHEDPLARVRRARQPLALAFLRHAELHRDLLAVDHVCRELQGKLHRVRKRIRHKAHAFVLPRKAVGCRQVHIHSCAKLREVCRQVFLLRRLRDMINKYAILNNCHRANA